MPEADQSFWQRFDDVRETAGLGKGQAFRCHEKNSHDAPKKIAEA
jgi:hypothetical protein